MRVARRGAVGNHADGLRCRVRRVVENLDVEHRRQAAQPLRADAERVDLLVQLGPQFLLVGLGTTGFLVAYGVQGGFNSLSGVLMGVGILGIGLLVLAFGIVTVIFSYRLESSRLRKVYEELRAVVDGTVTTA